MRTAVWLVVAVLGLGGCTAGRPGVASSGTASSGTASSARARPMSCAMESPGGGALRYQDDGSRYPTDFVPVAASRCIIVDGTHVEQVSYGPFEALVRALRQPSEPRQALPCPLPMPLGITLTDHSGRSIVPNPPRDFCGLPLASVVAAVDALPWRNVR